MARRYGGSRLLSPIKLLVSVEGPARSSCLIVTASLLAWAVYAISTDVLRDIPHDPSWRNFWHIAFLWFVANVSAMLFFALAEGPTLGVVDPAGKKFKLFPLFSWQTPLLQQAIFFWPGALFILKAIVSGSETFYNFPAHGVASLFGQQMRELVLFDSDLMMVGHHVVTMSLSAYIWWGMQTNFCDEVEAICGKPLLVALNGLSVAALEAGGLGVCVWTCFESPRAFYYILSASHALCLGAGWYCIYLDPSIKYFYVTFLLACPLIYHRQKYMLAEVAKGRPTGSFEAQNFEASTKKE